MRAMVVEPNHEQRKWLCQQIEQRPGWQVVARGSDPFEVVQRLGGEGPVDVLVINIDPVTNWDLQLWGLLRATLSEAKVLALTNSKSNKVVDFALGMNFKGLHRVNRNGQTIAAALDKVANGGQAYDSQLLDEYRLGLVAGEGADAAVANLYPRG